MKHSEIELLLSRYIDGDLNDDEKAMVENRIALEEGWSELYREFTQISEAIGSLKKEAEEIDLRAHFRENVYEKQTKPLNPFAYFYGLLNIKVSLATALALLLLTISAFWALQNKLANDPETVNLSSEPQKERADIVLVRFLLYKPEAARVYLTGDFNGWKPDEIPLEDETGDGFWTAAVPLKRGEYQYQFIIDGEKRIADPLAARIRPDGFGGVNSVISL